MLCRKFFEICRLHRMCFSSKTTVRGVIGHLPWGVSVVIVLTQMGGWD